MDYIKFYIKMHVKNWVWYVLSLFMLIPAWLSMLVGFFLGSFGIPEAIASIINLLLAAFILSSPVLYVNYIIAKNYLEDNNKSRSVIFLTATNHVATYLIYFIIFFILLTKG